ncbi:hypothetical protein B0J13DRAFT_457311 [Dactylonectria estremocensis]|uniref:DUF6536 domain-containing protein n=1 Tax=Dactylonectria estremocensis TaxID=1079267 RepID=A0A9P9DIU9_9HYPO|nr:hypothetical protein B0J13DRAFT_457311 [Dactylonectria estremocensis]
MPSQYLDGWRSGLAWSTSAAALVTIINMAFLCIAIPRVDRSATGGSEWAFFTGDCKTAKRLSTWLHLAINILATMLLAAGNYTAQVLTAPTRHEIDLAHSQQQWLDVGVSSLHNLRKISGKRVTAWMILVLSSVPIHLLYNSVIYLETGVNYYSIYPALWNDLIDPNHRYTDERYKTLRKSLDRFERLENQDCIAGYARKLISERSDVILIIDPLTPDNISDYTEVDGGDPMFSGVNYWICGQSYHVQMASCDVSTVDAKNWMIRAANTQASAEKRLRVESCLSKRTPGHCRLNLSTSMLAVVVGCNIIKLVGLVVTWLCLEKQPLLTLGDVMASFLEHNDPETKDMCLVSRSSGRPLSWQAGSRIWLPTKSHLGASVSRRRYGVTIGLCVLALVAVSYLLAIGVHSLKYSVHKRLGISDLWHTGLGQVSIDTLINIQVDRALSMVLLANLPQLVVSLLYAAVNGMWTAMLVENEWRSYGMRRKGLRTTCPVGDQRKTYWLSLPLSIFFVRLDFYQDNKRLSGNEGTITTCGYSPIAIIFSIVLGSLILIITIMTSLRTIKPSIPPGGTCSAVVSAACHQPEGNDYAAWGLVKWGVVPSNNEGGWSHCCITSWAVDAPERGRTYQ